MPSNASSKIDVAAASLTELLAGSESASVRKVLIITLKHHLHFLANKYLAFRCLNQALFGSPLD